MNKSKNKLKKTFVHNKNYGETIFEKHLLKFLTCCFYFYLLNNTLLTLAKFISKHLFFLSYS